MSQEVTQEWNSSRYAENAHFVPALGEALLQLLNPQRGERVLDLGCGDGVLTERIAARGAEVLGVDASADMIVAAKKKGLDVRVMDAYSLNFSAEFDAVFSNAALHWVRRDPDAVIENVRRTLRPDGRFVAEMGGHGNLAAITVALCAAIEDFGVSNPASLVPWYFPSEEEYRKRLENAGFGVEYMELIPRPTWLPTGMRGWLETFAGPFTKTLPHDRREAFLDQVTERLRPVLCDSAGNWTANYVRLRFLARANR
jgi:trans-aconitate methyltransferase